MTSDEHAVIRLPDEPPVGTTVVRLEDGERFTHRRHGRWFAPVWDDDMLGAHWYEVLGWAGIKGVRIVEDQS